MNAIELQIIGLMILGTVACVAPHENDHRAGDEISGSSIPGDIRAQQQQETCLFHPEYCQR